MKPLIMTCGLSGSGKTYNSKYLEKKLDKFRRVGPGIVRERLKIKTYSRKDTPKLLDLVIKEIEKNHKQGYGSILDANLKSNDLRQCFYDLAKNLGLEIILIEFYCSLKETKRRFKNRIQLTKAENPTEMNIYLNQKHVWQDPILDLKNNPNLSLIKYNTESQLVKVIKNNEFTKKIVALLKDKETIKPSKMAKKNSILYALKKYGTKSLAQNILSIVLSDVSVVSFQKSGRTWLRLMYGKILQRQYKINKIKLDTQFMTLFKPLPNVLFSHGGCTKNHNKLDFRKIFQRKKVVILARDPRAVMVSLYHDHTKRNFYLKEDNISRFIRHKDWGLPKVIKFMNDWATEIKRRNGKNILLIKYEDLYLETAKTLEKFIKFLGLKATPEILQEAIEFGSVKNMRKMELSKTFNDPRMLPGNVKDQQSYRTRKCKLGSFREELSKADLDYITKEIKNKLDSLYGYPNNKDY